MHIRESFDYPAHIDDVWDMMTDEEFQSRVCVATFAESHSVAVTHHTDGATVISRREMSTKGFPDFARNLVGHTITAAQTIDYGPPDAQGRRVGTMAIGLGHAPLGFKGRITLTPIDEEITEVSVEGELTCGIPIVGGRIVQAAAPMVTAGIRKEKEQGLACIEELYEDYPDEDDPEDDPEDD